MYEIQSQQEKCKYFKRECRSKTFSIQLSEVICSVADIFLVSAGIATSIRGASVACRVVIGVLATMLTTSTAAAMLSSVLPWTLSDLLTIFVFTTTDGNRTLACHWVWWPALAFFSIE
jgi:hypothetical protein